MLKWEESLKTGIDLIDSEHRELFDKVNDLLNAMSQGKGKKEVTNSLDFLESYVEKHFKDEERIQLESKYPYYSIQKHEHDDFRIKLRTLRSELEINTSPILILRVQNEMTEWWYNHIKKLDRELGEHLTGKYLLHK